jgi:uncharacterized protein
MSRRASLLLLLFLLPLAWALAKDVPPLTGRVNDTANLIPLDQRQRIETQLAQFEQQTGNQVSVLTVDSLDGEDIEGYANKVGRKWGLGQKGKDNGALLLVSKNDRKMRVEVGYGLEPVLTDLQTSIIQNQVIIPYFKKGDFGGGIEAGVSAILSTIQGKDVQPAPDAQPAGRGGESTSWPIFLLFGLFALGPFILNAIRSGSWIVYIVMLPIFFFLGSLAGVVVGMIAAGAWLVLFPILRMILPKAPALGRSRRSGGWWMGPGGFGGGGGWGGGGGGFSGGGGSFGGGGSSSSW